MLSVPYPTDAAVPRQVSSESHPFGDGTDSIIGTTFQADAFGYRYVWRITSKILTDESGRAFVWAEPFKRIWGRPGRPRRDVVWHLSLIAPPPSE